ncbi:MAG: type 1 glutamine amidotransferase domain-containing protein [Isosphaeraceae bacterium]
MTKILIVATGSNRLRLVDGTIKPTGFWAEELVVPHEQFRRAGFEVQIATPGGVPSPLDEGSLVPEMNPGGPDVIRHYREYLDAIPDLKHPLVLENLTDEELEGYDGLYLPGGHGPMEDLAHAKPLGRAVGTMLGRGRLISAICHGPAGLLTACDRDGGWAFRGYRLTGFTNEEERKVGMLDRMPLLLESRLREQGGLFESGPAWEPHVVTDRNLITGQNPASSDGVARQVIERL